ncbi:MAG: DoxX-like family protein [Sediminibacterium sp.]
MRKKVLHPLLTFIIAFVWLINGLFCKVLNLVPRHEQIVARILGRKYSKQLTIIIGIAEILIAVIVLIKCKTKMNAVMQMLIIASMNIVEFIVAPDLLLWGRANIILAFMLIWLIYYNEFVLKKQISSKNQL